MTGAAPSYSTGWAGARGRRPAPLRDTSLRRRSRRWRPGTVEVLLLTRVRAEARRYLQTRAGRGATLLTIGGHIKLSKIRRERGPGTCSRSQKIPATCPVVAGRRVINVMCSRCLKLSKFEFNVSLKLKNKILFIVPD